MASFYIFVIIHFSFAAIFPTALSYSSSLLHLVPVCLTSPFLLHVSCSLFSLTSCHPEVFFLFAHGPLSQTQIQTHTHTHPLYINLCSSCVKISMLIIFFDMSKIEKISK